MAFEIGTATSAADLYAKLQTFLKTNVDLVAATEEWTEVWNGTTIGTNPTDVLLQGPGTSGTAEVLIGMRLFEDVPGDRYHIRISGATGILVGSDSYDAHVNSTPQHVYIPLDAGAMSYWFVANGSRFVIVVKISTVFEAAYAGLFLPYSDPIAYPYPLFIGGSAGNFDLENSPEDWRDATDGHTHFTNPQLKLNVSRFGSPAKMLDPAGLWTDGENYAYTDASSNMLIGPLNHNGFWEYEGENDAVNEYWYQPRYLYGRMREAFGGDFPLWRMELTGQDGPTNFGVLDGVTFCQQFQNSAENLITIGGVDHLVVQNVFRTGEFDYWALALE